MLKILAYYAQYYAHVKELCLKSDCSIRVYLLLSKFVNVLLEYNKYGECFIRVITSMVSVLLEYIDLY